MTYSGKVINGTIVLDNGGELPEGAEVRVEITAASAPRPGSPAWALQFAGTLTDDEADLIMHGAQACRVIDPGLWR